MTTRTLPANPERNKRADVSSTKHKIPTVLMGGVIIISLALTTSVTFGLLERQAVPSEARAAAGTTVLETRSLLFFDERDGTVRVEGALTRHELASFGPG